MKDTRIKIYYPDTEKIIFEFELKEIFYVLPSLFAFATDNAHKLKNKIGLVMSRDNVFEIRFLKRTNVKFKKKQAAKK